MDSKAQDEKANMVRLEMLFEHHARGCELRVVQAGTGEPMHVAKPHRVDASHLDIGVRSIEGCGNRRQRTQRVLQHL